MPKAPTLIVTRRLVLRQPTERDIPTIVRELGRLDVARWLGRVPHPYVARHARSWLAHQRRERAAARDMTFAITLASRPERMIGAIGCHRIDDDAPTLGYWLRPGHWGRGYASEAVAAVLQCLLTLSPDARPRAAALPDNERSIRTLLKAGFRRDRRDDFDWIAAQRRKLRVRRFTLAATSVRKE